MLFLVKRGGVCWVGGGCLNTITGTVILGGRVHVNLGVMDGEKLIEGEVFQF